MILMHIVKADKTEFMIEKIEDTKNKTNQGFLYRVLMNGKPVMVTEDYEIARELVIYIN